ncbi:MAG: Rrf2 family transcriptional regulator [Acidobacteriota bacterium]|nr:Rrf2 family transcriptional regulator [Acidobacteriota bacterium]
MKLSKKGEYGIRAVGHLAERHGEGVIHIREIAEQESIPAKFLEGILLQLKRAGVVNSRRGVEGGYALARPPDRVMLGEVIRVLDGPLAPMGSAAELKQLMRGNPRQAGLYSILMDVRDAAAAILDRTSFADLVTRNRELRRS